MAREDTEAEQPITSVREYSEPRTPTAFVTLTAAFIALMGILYLWFPIMPYHEEIIGTTAAELSETNTDVYRLMTVLVNVMGVSFLAIATSFFALGQLAVQNRTAFVVLILLFVVFTIPLTYLVVIAGGPVELTAIGAILHLGTILAIGREHD